MLQSTLPLAYVHPTPSLPSGSFPLRPYIRDHLPSFTPFTLYETGRFIFLIIFRQRILLHCLTVFFSVLTFLPHSGPKSSLTSLTLLFLRPAPDPVLLHLLVLKLRTHLPSLNRLLRHISSLNIQIPAAPQNKRFSTPSSGLLSQTIDLISFWPSPHSDSRSEPRTALALPSESSLSPVCVR